MVGGRAPPLKRVASFVFTFGAGGLSDRIILRSAAQMSHHNSENFGTLNLFVSSCKLLEI
jgi:hypothetical protein